MSDLSGVIIRGEAGRNTFIQVGETKNGISVRRNLDQLTADFGPLNHAVEGLGVLDPTPEQLERVKRAYHVAG
jgi:hypothetical protein